MLLSLGENYQIKLVETFQGFPQTWKWSIEMKTEWEKLESKERRNMDNMHDFAGELPTNTIRFRLLL